MLKRIGVIFLVATVIAIMFFDLFEMPFNAQHWQTKPLERYEMVDNLIESQILIGKDRSEVIDILGQPDSKSGSNKDVFVYVIGSAPSIFSSKKEYLVIVFKNQIVDKVTLATE